MSVEDHNRHKVCHCTVHCNRLLGLAQRKNHYQLVNNPLTIRRSTTPSDYEDISSDNDHSNGSENGSMDIDKQQNQDDVDINVAGLPYDFAETQSVENEHTDAGQEAGDGFFDGSDDEDWEFDPNDDLAGPSLLLDEIQEALEDEIGPGMDLEMWNLREL
jgi:hypothetical protein